jgi:hypothetical protein
MYAGKVLIVFSATRGRDESTKEREENTSWS